MKTSLVITRKNTLKTLGFLMTFLLISTVWNSVSAQTSKVASSEVKQEGKIIKGVISTDEGPLESASVVLKGSSVGTATDVKGEFTFPKPLNIGDILLITYLGFETQEVKIKETTTFLKLQLTEDLIEFTGALNTNAPYKSKRSKE